MEINGIVLAGGKSLRFGNDKASEAIGSKSLLQQVITSLRFLDGEIIVVTSDEHPISESIDHPKLRILTDILPGKGPLGGIYTGLAASTTEYNLVVASDMPFLNEALLRYQIEISEGYDITVPRLGKLVEPLHAIYARSCLGPMAEMIKQEHLSIYQLFRRVRVRYMEAAEIERFDPEHRSLFNINTKTDLATARRLAGGLTR
ncbi:MAG: molybdenum cofactor guanylyltransferase [Chloroflexi bacterium]|nr:molybdenum cofactor guanylyltransferase [Chloroflexota bacterium]